MQTFNARTPSRNRASRSRRSRQFSAFVALTLLISLALIALAILRENDGPISTQGSLEDPPVATFALLDVGQALSAAIVTADGYSLVYDFGLSRADAEETIVPFLDERGVSEIDFAILSHPHQDHVGGLPALLEAMPIGLYIDPVLETTNQTYARSLEIIEERGASVAIARQGDTYSLGEHVELEILWPGEELLLESDGVNRLNDNSTVVRVDIGDVSILLTGDIERDGESMLVETLADRIDVDILQVAHHGSNTSSQDGFLGAATPSLAAIPVGRDNRYGHPHTEVMQRLRQREIQIFRTDVDGTVIIHTDGQTWDVVTTETDLSWSGLSFALPSITSSWTSTTTGSPFWYSMMVSN